MKTSPETLIDKIVAYYDQTWIDYRVLWLNRNNLAFHFGYYDETTRGHAEALLNSNRVLADRVAIQPGERVLDAGCGVGGSAFWLAQHRGVEVVGITPVESQIARARRLADAQGLAERVTFEQADYTCTPFPDASFDVVWSQESLCHAPEKAAFYREAARLLRPGGRLVVAEYIRRTRPLDESGERMMREWLDGWAIPDLDTREEHIGYANAAGLSKVTLEDETAHVRPSLRRLYRFARWLYPLGVVLLRLRIRSEIQHGNVMAALRQYQALQRGLWFYGILSATK